MIVEDDTDLKNLLKTFFESESFESHWAKSPEHALEILSRIKVDLIILDFLLNDQLGLPIAKFVEKWENDVRPKIVAVSGSVGGGFIARDLKDKGIIHEYIEKPFQLEDLKQVIMETV